MNFSKIHVPLEKLILDPNNPRFSKNEHELITDESKFANPAVQEEALAKMVGDKDQFDIISLKKSIQSNGFVEIVQPIMVRKIGEYYLVIEGNRRTSALKELHRKHNSGKVGDELSEELLETMRQMPVVDCTDASKDEISVLLGMIHVGGTKDWELLPSSFYIYKLYAELLGSKHHWNSEQVAENFVYDATIAKSVAAKASISSTKVKDNLRVYRVFKQLSDEATDRTGDESLVNSRKASLIQESCKSQQFEQYFSFNTSTFIMGSEGIDRWLHLMTEDENEEPVIENPNDLRDFKKVLAQGGPEHVDRIYNEGEKPGRVLAEIVAQQNERTLHVRLKTVKAELGKIDIEGLGDFAEAEKELLDHIDEKIKRIRAAAII